MMATHTTIASFFSGVLLLSIVLTGGVFYGIVLPKFHPEQQPSAPPEPKKDEAIHLINPAKATAVPRIAALPGTTIVRLAHHTSNAHLAWGLANMGQVTDPGSIFARHGITLQFRRLETTAERIAALQAMAAAFNADDALPAGNSAGVEREAGVHFFTVAGDASSWILSQTNKALQTVHPAFEAEIIGFAGSSAGEDAFLGSAEWKKNPQLAVGGVVAGVPYDSAWNVMLFWCAQHAIPFNSDQAYYDPRALNFVETASPDAAAAMYIDKATVARIFLADGEDYRERTVKKGAKGDIAINGVTTHLPVAKRIAAQRGGLVTVASTKHSPNHTPQFIVGLKQWNRRHQAVVVSMLAALFEASQQIEHSHRDVKAQRLTPKAHDDTRWQAAQYVHALFDAGSPDEWYDTYDGTAVKDRRGLLVEVGGAAVANLQQNLLFFGLGQSGPDRGKAVYHRFAALATQYDPHVVAAYPEWEQAFNKVYLEDVLRQFPTLAQTDPTLPTFAVTFQKERPVLTYHIPFEMRLATLTLQSEAVLNQVLVQMGSVGEARIEIHGYTDSFGSEESNMALSRRRGEMIYSWLQEKLGAAFPKHVQVIPHGKNDLLVNDQVHGEYVPELMAQNRRVVLKIFPL